jgi:hypothetical protein
MGRARADSFAVNGGKADRAQLHSLHGGMNHQILPRLGERKSVSASNIIRLVIGHLLTRPYNPAEYRKIQVARRW